MKAKINGIEFEIESQKDLEILMSGIRLVGKSEPLPEQVRHNLKVKEIEPILFNKPRVKAYHTKRRLTSREKVFIKNQRKLGTLTLTEIAAALGRNISTISTYLKSRNMPFSSAKNNRNQRWTKEEDDLINSERSISDLRGLIKRSRGAITQRRWKFEHNKV